MIGEVRRASTIVLVIAMTMGCTGDDGSGAPTASRPVTTTEVVAATTTEPPVSGSPLIVAEQGLSAFPDPIDPLSSLGGYGVVLENPNPDLMATGVRVVTRILDAAGTELLVDSAVLNAVPPGRRMAVGRTLIEPIVDPTQLDVSVEVSAWIVPASTTGTLSATQVITEPEQGGGLVTIFTVTSTWPKPEEGVDVTAVYRAADGRILGAESATLAVVAPGADVPVRILLLSPIPDMAATEVLVGRGFAAQTIG